MRYMIMALSLCGVLLGCGARDNPYDYAQSNNYQSDLNAAEDEIQVYCDCSEDSSDEANARVSVDSGGIADGVVLRVAWKDVEPAPGEFNWDSIDSRITSAKSNGLSVILAIVTGPNSPAWLVEEGAEFFISHSNGFVRPLFPLPWDGVFISRYTYLIENLGRRYDANDTIKRVRMTNSTSSGYEMSFGFNGDDNAEFIASGFSVERITFSWIAVINAYASSFKKTPLDIVVQPILGDTGTTSSVADYGLSTLGPRFGVHVTDWNLNTKDVYDTRLVELGLNVAQTIFTSVGIGRISVASKNHAATKNITFIESLRSVREAGVSQIEMTYNDLKDRSIIESYYSYMREDELRRLAH